ncbi:hypothetical protein C0J52_26595 [Blattella germanica]|nr:hypothetical protein C0J52_26595 [Blattella germanica]
MSLYFNIYFFPIWLVTVLLMLHLKYESFSHIYSFIVVTVLVAVIGIEFLRLYIGKMGNLKEKVPELGDVSPAAVSVATIPVGERKHRAVSNGACRSGNNAVLSSCADHFRFFAVRHASQHQANFFHRMEFTSTSDLTNQYRPLCKKG